MDSVSRLRDKANNENDLRTTQKPPDGINGEINMKKKNGTLFWLFLIIFIGNAIAFFATTFNKIGQTSHTLQFGFSAILFLIMFIDVKNNHE